MKNPNHSRTYIDYLQWAEVCDPDSSAKQSSGHLSNVKDADVSTAGNKTLLQSEARPGASAAQYHPSEWNIEHPWRKCTSLRPGASSTKTLEEPATVNFSYWKVPWANVRGNPWTHRFGYTRSEEFEREHTTQY